MKTQDLRLGNFLKYDDNILCEVAEIYNNVIYCFDKYGEDLHCMEFVKPIELTEDILIKAGFKKGYNEIYSKTIKNDFYEYNISYQNVKDNKYSFVASGYKNNELKRQIRLDNIQYLHQLQNAYYLLTNQELEIDL